MNYKYSLQLLKSNNSCSHKLPPCDKIQSVIFVKEDTGQGYTTDGLHAAHGKSGCGPLHPTQNVFTFGICAVS